MSNSEPKNYDKLQRIFLEALELPDGAKRQAYLDEVCAGDAAVKEIVQELIAEFEAGGASTEYVLASSQGTEKPEPRDSAMFVPGKVLAERYRIVSLLGKGGMGEVFRADDLKLDQPVAQNSCRQRWPRTRRC